MQIYSGDPSFLDDPKLKRVLQLIRSRKLTSRAEVADILGLNRSTVTAIINELLDQKLVREVGIGVSKGGRPPKLLQFNFDSAYTACVDWSTYRAKVFITDLNGNIFFSKRLDSDLDESYTVQIQKIIDIISQGLRELPPKHLGLLGIGIGVPGIIDSGTTVSSYALNWVQVPLLNYFTEAFQCPVVINSDANAGLIAEKYFGIAQGEQNVCYLRVGKSLGAGLMLNGDIYRQTEGFNGRVGHFIIDVNGRKCTCGNRGCWEAYASERALMQRYMEILGDQQVDSSLDITKLIELIKSADPHAVSVFNEFTQYLGIGISNIVNFLNPDLIVINTPSGLIDNLSYHPFKSVLQDNILPHLQKNMKVMFSTLGENDITLGATAMVLDKIFSYPEQKII